MTNKPVKCDTRTVDVLAAHLSALERLTDERDRLYQEQFTAAKEAVAIGLAAQKEGTASAFAASEKALLLKSAELERRLEALNGEASRLATVLAQSVPREVWEESQKSDTIWRQSVDKQLAAAAGRDRGFSISWGVILGIVGALAGVAAFVKAL